MENNYGYTTIISRRAQKEITASYDWYEERQINLGDRFQEELFIKIHSIAHNPELYPLAYRSYRETRLKTFPILIIYRIDKRKKAIYIVSVFHTARNIKNKF